MRVAKAKVQEIIRSLPPLEGKGCEKRWIKALLWEVNTAVLEAAAAEGFRVDRLSAEGHHLVRVPKKGGYLDVWPSTGVSLMSDAGFARCSGASRLQEVRDALRLEDWGRIQLQIFKS